ncbi:acetate/propionate family kinase [Baekduia soli]|uniref:Acetate kinase n=1 Tax=Baekduia soli TaxID=496014 RepID=A0A5B8U9I9_9ACTN|nr:acetate/propionate family kinase [Baekduia soli]QEC49839.1 acetate/propionate family kinase [Baekduia soli]
MRVLVVNAGSSSLRLRLVGADDAVLWARDLKSPGGRAGAGALQAALREPGAAAPDAVGHRIVHGGPDLHAAVRIDGAVEARLHDLVALAPLHQPKSLAALDAVRAALPAVPAWACFDTAFHATLPAAAATYALPLAWRERWDLRRYGFHGLSHAGVARRFGTGRVVSCHLGAGASLCAIADGRSVDTTMGFTPLEGLVMATRSGSVDPGLLLWLLQDGGLGAGEIADALEHGSGLAGLAGTPDLAEVLARAEAGDERCVLGRDAYVHRLRAAIAAMAAALGGLDTLVFTGGAGEHAPELRARAAAGLGFLGVVLHDARNAAARHDADISATGAAVRTHVLTAREDAEIARQVRAAAG